jgi:hypothetical protein
VFLVAGDVLPHHLLQHVPMLRAWLIREMQPAAFLSSRADSTIVLGAPTPPTISIRTRGFCEARAKPRKYSGSVTRPSVTTNMTGLESL